MKKTNVLRRCFALLMSACMLVQVPVEIAAAENIKSYQVEGVENIRRGADGAYAMVSGGQTMAVTKEEVSFADGKKVQNLIENEELPVEVVQSIQENYDRLKALGIEKKVKVEIYTPKSIPKTATSRYANGTETTTYYTYKNTKMKNYQVVYKSLSSGTQRIKQGKSASKFASQIPSLILTLLGNTAKKELQVLSFKGSLLQIFYNVFGSDSVSANTRDYIELDLDFDKVDQWTYAKLGDSYYIGLFSQKVIIREAEIKQYYYNAKKRKGNKVVTTKHGLSKVIKGEHYSSPWATAYTFAGSPRNENVRAKWGSVTFYFNNNY